MNSFLQSSFWLDFQKSLGRKVWRRDSAGIIKHNLPFAKSYLYAPRLRFSSFDEQARCEGFLNEIKKIAKEERAIFLKLEPEDNIDFQKFGLHKSTNIQPQKTLVLDITKSEKGLLGQMHHKTRYNIRLAKRKNIKIKKDKNKFQDYWRLIQKTIKRDKFKCHPKEYYKKMLELPIVELFVAIYKNKIIAANIVVFYKRTATYLHGASDYEYRNLMAPHLLQWHQILEAKKRECVEYDFWGIDEKKWPGVTRFKKGFGGKEVIYPGAYDLVFQPIWYGIYKLAKKIL